MSKEVCFGCQGGGQRSFYNTACKPVDYKDNLKHTKDSSFLIRRYYSFQQNPTFGGTLGSFRRSIFGGIHLISLPRCCCKFQQYCTFQQCNLFTREVEIKRVSHFYDLLTPPPTLPPNTL